MGYDLKRDDVATPGSAPGSVRTPGKRTRTEALPAREPRHHTMTDEVLLDQGSACQDKEPDGESCFMEPWQRERAATMIAHRLGVMLTSQHAALSNVKLYKATKNDHMWNGLMEIVFLAVTGPMIGPIASVLGGKIGGMAMTAAELGLPRTAWTLAGGADPSKLTGAITIAFKGIRGQLAHADGRPRDLNAHQQFLTHLQSAAGQASIELMDSVASMTDAELLKFASALKDPSVTGVEEYERRLYELLAQFDENRIEVLGNQMFGTREVALVKRARLRGREYVVLLESFGIKNSALALNGAPDGTTMDSLMFVRMVERSMHGLAIAETTRKRGEVESINFDQRAVRSEHPWFRDMYRAIKSHPNPDEIGVGVADDPFDFHAMTSSPDGADEVA